LSRFAGFKNLTQGILFILLIIVVVIFFAWLILSGVGNCMNPDEVKSPSIEDAQYRVFIRASNEVVFTHDYDEPEEGIYILNGYYEYKDGKYKHHESLLTLNEYYYGPIEISKRQIE